MPGLTVQFTPASSGAAWRVVRAVFVREVGRAAGWSFALRSDDPKQYLALAEAASADSLGAQLLWQDKPLGPPADVGAMRLDRENGQTLHVEAVTTRTDAPAGALPPRRRVLTAVDLRGLLGLFADFALLPDAVAALAQQVSLFIRPAVIQDGKTDWEMLQGCLAECRLRHADHVPLTLTGGDGSKAGARTRGRWVITPAAEKHCRDAGYAESHRFDPTKSLKEMPDEAEFAPGASADGRQGAVAARLVFHRKDVIPLAANLPTLWDDWCALDAPQFWIWGNGDTKTQKTRFIPRIEDRFDVIDDNGDVRWTTAVDVPPPNFATPLPAGPSLRPWLGVGVVAEAATKQPWFTVKLPGFEKDLDKLTVQLASPYSGKNGKRGWHAVPEKDTEVYVGWSGRCTDMAVYLGNVRTAWPGKPPALLLDAELRMALEGVAVSRVAEVRVASSLTVSGERAVSLRSGEDLKLSNGQAEAALSGDAFQVGRPG